MGRIRHLFSIFSSIKRHLNSRQFVVQAGKFPSFFSEKKAFFPLFNRFQDDLVHDVSFQSRRFSNSRRSLGTLLILGSLFFFGLTFSSRVEGATYETANFIVSADSDDFARLAAETAETCRRDLAVLWLGTELRQWSMPCTINVRTGKNLGAGGETSFTFQNNEVFGWEMDVQGSEERILDSVIPHEVTHTILATYFRQPVPRWIDEGSATSVESHDERANYRNMLIGFLNEGKGLPFNEMVRLKEYPKDQMPFYSQGFSVCEYLILVGGHRRLVEFAKLGTKSGNWNHALQKYYGYKNLGELQISWQNWISEWYLAGMPDQLPDVIQLAEFNPNPTAPLADSTNVRPASGTMPSNAAAVSQTGLVVPSRQGPATQQVAASIPKDIFTNGVGSVSPNPQTVSKNGDSSETTNVSSQENRTPSNPPQRKTSYQGSYGNGLAAPSNRY